MFSRDATGANRTESLSARPLCDEGEWHASCRFQMRDSKPIRISRNDRPRGLRRFSSPRVPFANARPRPTRLAAPTLDSLSASARRRSRLSCLPSFRTMDRRVRVRRRSATPTMRGSGFDARDRLRFRQSGHIRRHSADQAFGRRRWLAAAPVHSRSPSASGTTLWAIGPSETCVEGGRPIELVDPLLRHEYVAPTAFALDEQQ